ncbi:hypothetical protein ACOMHN_059153 [Nucella lapillus]
MTHHLTCKSAETGVEKLTGADEQNIDKWGPTTKRRRTSLGLQRYTGVLPYNDLGTEHYTDSVTHHYTPAGSQHTSRVSCSDSTGVEKLTGADEQNIDKWGPTTKRRRTSLGLQRYTGVLPYNDLGTEHYTDSVTHHYTPAGSQHTGRVSCFDSTGVEKLTGADEQNIDKWRPTTKRRRTSLGLQRYTGVLPYNDLGTEHYTDSVTHHYTPAGSQHTGRVSCSDSTG